MFLSALGAACLGSAGSGQLLPPSAVGAALGLQRTLVSDGQLMAGGSPMAHGELQTRSGLSVPLLVARYSCAHYCLRYLDVIWDRRRTSHLQPRGRGDAGAAPGAALLRCASGL